MLGMPIPSFYAISPNFQTLRLVEVPSYQNTRWRLSFPLFIDKRQEFFVLSSHTIPNYLNLEGWLSWCRTCAINIFEPSPFNLQAFKLIEPSVALIWLVKALCSCSAQALVIESSKCSHTLESASSMLESWCFSLPSSWKWFVLESESSTSSK